MTGSEVILIDRIIPVVKASLDGNCFPWTGLTSTRRTSIGCIVCIRFVNDIYCNNTVWLPQFVNFTLLKELCHNIRPLEVIKVFLVNSELGKYVGYYHYSLFHYFTLTFSCTI